MLEDAREERRLFYVSALAVRVGGVELAVGQGVVAEGYGSGDGLGVVVGGGEHGTHLRPAGVAAGGIRHGQ